MQTEIELLKLRASNSEQKIETINEEMCIELSNNADTQLL